MGTTTPPRNNLTQRIYSLQPPSPQPHDGCGLDITWPLLCDAFKPPSKREINQWLASSESTSILTLSPQTSSKSPSIFTLSPDSSPLVSGSAAAPTSSSIDEACEYLKLQEKNILEKHFIVYDNTWIKMEITNSCLIWSCGSPNNWATPVRIEVSVPGTESPVWPATISNKYLCVCMNGLVRDYCKSFPRILGFKIRELHIETILPVCVLCMTDFGGQNSWNESTDIPSNCPLFMTDWH